MRLNLAGYKWLWFDGYGRLSLKTAQALLRLGHDIYPFEVELLDKPAWYLQAAGLQFDRVTIQLCPPDMMKHIPGRSVAFTMHETETLPYHWADWINDKNQWVLTPSYWMRDVLTDNGVKLPIEVVPAGIDPEECSIVMPHRNQPYTFICLGDRGDRKGWDTTWSAFYKVFGRNNRNVRLIIKCRPGSLPKGMDFSYSPDDRLSIWRTDVANIADVFAVADACINPNRAEGLGMWPREAAACGLPVVTTRYSGTADDIDEWAIPIENFTLTESHMQGAGGLWATPSLDEVCEHMLWLYEHQDEGRAKGLKSAQWLRDNRTYMHSAKRITEILCRWLGGPVSEMPSTSVDIPQAIESNKAAVAQLKQVLKPTNGHVTKKELELP